MTYPNELTNPAQSNWPVRVNEALKSFRNLGLYAPNDLTTTGLTLGYFGGYLDDSVTISDGTVGPLAASDTSYIVAHRTTGVVSHATTTTNWNDTTTYGRLFSVDTGGSTITTIRPWHLLAGGIFGSGVVSSIDASAVTYTPGDLDDWTSSDDPGDVDDALDQIADRVSAIESGGVISGQAAIQFQDEASNLGTSGTVTEVDFTGSGVTASRAGNKVTVSVSAGGGSGTKTYAVFTPMTSQPPAANFATLDTRNSIAVLDFDDSTEESTFWVGVMPEAASLGSGLIVNIFFMATSATSGDARFGAQFERMNTDEDSDSFDTATEATVATSGTSGIITKLAITCTTIDSIAAGDPYRLKIYRDTSGADTVTGDLEVVCVELRSAA